jgi:hypothetical protein
MHSCEFGKEWRKGLTQSGLGLGTITWVVWVQLSLTDSNSARTEKEIAIFKNNF